MFGNDSNGHYGLYIYYHECDKNRISSSSLHAYENVRNVSFLSLANKTNFQVAKIEVFGLTFDSTMQFRAQPKVGVVVTTTPSLSCSFPHSEIFKDTFDSVASFLADIQKQENLVRESESELLPDAIAFRDELRYVAKIAGIELSSVNVGKTLSLLSREPSRN